MKRNRNNFTLTVFHIKAEIDQPETKLKGLGHTILGNFVYFCQLLRSFKRQIGRERVFHLQNHGHVIE